MHLLLAPYAKAAPDHAHHAEQRGEPGRERDVVPRAAQVGAGGDLHDDHPDRGDDRLPHRAETRDDRRQEDQQREQPDRRARGQVERDDHHGDEDQPDVEHRCAQAPPLPAPPLRAQRVFRHRSPSPPRLSCRLSRSCHLLSACFAVPTPWHARLTPPCPGVNENAPMPFRMGVRINTLRPSRELRIFAGAEFIPWLSRCPPRVDLDG